MCDDCYKKRGLLGGLIIGGAIASGLYFLFGTDKGKQVRKRIEEKGGEVAEDLQDMLEDLEEKGAQYKEKAEEVAQELKETVSEKMEQGSDIAKRELGEKIDTALTKSEELLDKGKEVTQNLHSDFKQRFFKNIKK